MAKIIIDNKFNAHIDLIDDSRAIEVDEETLKQIGKTKCFDVINNCVIDYDDTNEQILENKTREITLIRDLLSKSDYICLKWCEGQISDIEYEYTKNKRKEYRLKINQLEQEIEQLKKAS